MTSVNNTASCALDRVYLSGMWIDNVTMDDAIDEISRLVDKKKDAVVVTPNVDHVVRAQTDARYRQIVDSADLVLADGQPLVWLSRLTKQPLRERVAGSDLFPRLCERSAQEGYRVFLLGGEAGVADEARCVLESRFPGLNVVGTHCPPMGFEADPALREAAIFAVKAADPEIVFVGLGSPKQELWIDDYHQQYAPAVSIGVGISFSFVTGHVKRAPVWMRKVGLEWLWRILREPRRLWRRYWNCGIRFVPIAWRDYRASRTRSPEAH